MLAHSGLALITEKLQNQRLEESAPGTCCSKLPVSRHVVVYFCACLYFVYCICAVFCFCFFFLSPSYHFAVIEKRKSGLSNSNTIESF